VASRRPPGRRRRRQGQGRLRDGQRRFRVPVERQSAVQRRDPRLGVTATGGRVGGSRGRGGGGADSRASGRDDDRIIIGDDGDRGGANEGPRQRCGPRPHRDPEPTQPEAGQPEPARLQERQVDSGGRVGEPRAVTRDSEPYATGRQHQITAR